MNNIPKDINEIINTYIAQIEHFQKYKKVLSEIKEDLKIEYLVPIFECNSGYIIKSVKYKEQKLKRLSSIICFCCGREINKTHDEYINDEYISDEEIEEQIYLTYNGINDDWYEENYVIMRDLSQNEYVRIQDMINIDINNLVINGNGFEIIIELEEDDNIEEDILDMNSNI